MFRVTLTGIAALLLSGCRSQLVGSDSGVAGPGSDSGVAGPAQPMQIASGQEFNRDSYISEIALTDDYVNFTVPWHGLYRVPKYGGDRATIEADPDVSFNDVAATRDTIVWTETLVAGGDGGAPQPARVMRRTGNDDPVVLADNFEPLDAFRVGTRLKIGGDTVYMYLTPMGGVLAIYAVPLAGGSVRMVAEIVGTQYTPTWVPSDSYIYYVDYLQASLCEVRRVDVNGGTPEDFAPCPTPNAIAPPQILAVDDASVYLFDVDGDKGLLALPKAGGPAVPVTIATSPLPNLGADRTVVDGQNLYYPEFSPTLKVRSMPKTGGVPKPIADLGENTAVISSTQMVQDGNYLFLRNGDISVIPKMPVAP